MNKAQKTFHTSQRFANASQEYVGSSLVLRESIISLSLRLFFAEFLLGILGIGIRIPLLYIFSSVTGPVQTYGLYGIFYLLFQTINVGVIIFILLDWYRRSYTIRSKDIHLQSGVFSVKDELLQYDNMEKVHVSQTLIGRIGNFGTIEMYNPLLNQSTFFKNIPHPRVYAEKIQNAIPKNNAQPIVINK